MQLAHIGQINQRYSLHQQYRYFKADIRIPDLYVLARVAGREPYNLHDLVAHAS